MEDISKTLEGRETTYGDYATLSSMVQEIKRVFRASPNWIKFADYQRESLDMIANKLGRVEFNLKRIYSHRRD